MIKGYTLNYDRETVRKLDLSKKEQEINDRAKDLADRQQDSINTAKAFGFIPGIEAADYIPDEDFPEAVDLDQVENILNNDGVLVEPVPEVNIDELRASIRQELSDEIREESLQKARDEIADEAEQIIAKAKEDADRMVQEAVDKANAEAEAAKASIISLASKQGYEDGTARAKAEEDAVMQELENKRLELQEQYERQVKEMEPAFVKILKEYLKKITGLSFEKYESVFEYLIDRGINQVQKESDFTVYMNKDDYDRFSSKFDEISSRYSDRFRLTFAEDRNLKSGDFRLENDTTIVECGLGNELNGIIESLDMMA